MAGKRKKFLLGADFIDENLTRDGKPKAKGSSDDADNTQELEKKSSWKELKMLKTIQPPKKVLNM